MFIKWCHIIYNNKYTDSNKFTDYLKGGVIIIEINIHIFITATNTFRKIEF